MDSFLSCDWGTSSFRLTLVDATSVQPIAETKNGNGIAATFNSWKEKGEPDRLSYYLQTIRAGIADLERHRATVLQGAPLIVSGMASSSIGMINLPYKTLPFRLDPPDLKVEQLESTEDFPHRLFLVSGARTPHDVMRGEETQLLGAISDFTNDQLFIFPGTHSKHIRVSKGKAIDFKTYMTGEFFELLSRKSTLAEAVESGNDLEDRQYLPDFAAGVKDSLTTNLLHQSFRVRANYLADPATAPQNYFYLSGLLIGTELKDLTNDQIATISLVGEAGISALYQTAFRILELDAVLHLKDVQQAVMKGHYQILSGLLQ